MKNIKIGRIIIVVVAMVLLGVVATFLGLMILYTPNINCKLTINTNDVYGSVATKVSNAKNGIPNDYYSFDNTIEKNTYKWQSKNILFKDDKEYIQFEFLVKNQSQHNYNCVIKYNNVHKNAIVKTYLNSVEQDIHNIILKPDIENLIVVNVTKKNVKKPLRGNLNIVMNISKIKIKS